MRRPGHSDAATFPGDAGISMQIGRLGELDRSLPNTTARDGRLQCSGGS